jgi:hypothetical protein
MFSSVDGSRCVVQHTALGSEVLLFSCKFSAILQLKISASLLIKPDINQERYFISMAYVASNVTF